jgi:hypothetical protein
MRMLLIYENKVILLKEIYAVPHKPLSYIALWAQKPQIKKMCSIQVSS